MSIQYNGRVKCEVFVSAKKGSPLEGFKLFYEEIAKPKRAQQRIRRLRTSVVNS